MQFYSGPERQRLVFGFNDFLEKSRVIDRLDRLQFLGGTTATGKALELALMALNDRDRQQKAFVITLTDGFSQDKVANIAEKIRALPNVEKFAVGLTDSLDDLNQ